MNIYKVIGLKKWAAGFISGWAIMSYAQTLNLSDLPLSIQSNVPPNIVVTLDDSGSMKKAYMPNTADAGERNYYRSSHYNRLYYNPEVTYVAPSKSNGDTLGDAIFSNAIRGFYNSSNSESTLLTCPNSLLTCVDLSKNFRALLSQEANRPPSYLDGKDCPTNLCKEQPAYYYQFNASGCTGTAAPQRLNEACYTKVVITNAALYSGGANSYGRVQTEEETNFANWYQYYATRLDASKSAMLRAFVPEAVDSSVRVARQAINQKRIKGAPIRSGGPQENNLHIAEFDATERRKFYDWVRSVPAKGGTPLRRAVYRAGEFFKTTNPYQRDPLSSNSGLVGCRVNTHIMVTDGFYTGDFTLPSGFLLDQNKITLPAPNKKVYSPDSSPIYSNSKDSASLSDLTFHYWATDLRPDLDNNITPFASSSAGVDPDDYWDPRNDPATWQHMNSFGIAFGAEGRIKTDDATYQRLLSGTQQWPKTNTGLITTIDDLYHSGINGRGGFFSAGDPDELVDALKAITDRLGERKGSVPEVGATSTRISSGANVYIASFDTNSWSGDLQAYQISDGSDFGKTSISGCDSKPLGTLCGDSKWSAAKRNNDTDIHMNSKQRVIFTYNPALKKGQRGVPFVWDGANLNAAQKSHLNQSDKLGKKRLNYIRGSKANEMSQGGMFKTRTDSDGGSVTRVGAIVHSTPVYVSGGGNDLQFRFPDGLEDKPYKINTREPMVYVGENDGMLHAYYAKGSSRGQEAFSYIPNAVIKHLHEMTDPDFRAGAYVDGPLDIQDAYVGNKWRTLLAGGLRSGGQGYFMLDVTRPPSNVSDPNKTVMWEYTDEDDADMGYTYGQPVIVKSNYSRNGSDGEWVVLLANGYNSTEDDGNIGSGKAVLYVLLAETGELIAKFELGNSSTPNGLSSPVAVSDSDVQNFGNASGTDPDLWVVDYAYAGDLQGNLWKFDLSSTNVANWAAYKLYAAGANKPITAKPSVGSFPKRGTSLSNKESRFIYFGTGQYLELDDVSTTSNQTFYSLVDDDTCKSTDAACIKNGDLLTQTITSQGVLSNNTIDVDRHKGCQLDLTAGNGAAERVIYQSAVVDGVVLFSTLTPNGDVCKAGVSGALYALNRFTCGATVNPVLDTNRDGVINFKDTNRKVADSADPGKPPSSLSSPKVFVGPVDKLVILTPDGPEEIKSGDRKGRVRWRQIK